MTFLSSELNILVLRVTLFSSCLLCVHCTHRVHFFRFFSFHLLMLLYIGFFLSAAVAAAAAGVAVAVAVPCTYTLYTHSPVIEFGLLAIEQPVLFGLVKHTDV